MTDIYTASLFMWGSLRLAPTSDMQGIVVGETELECNWRVCGEFCKLN